MKSKPSRFSRTPATSLEATHKEYFMCHNTRCQKYKANKLHMVPAVSVLREGDLKQLQLCVLWQESQAFRC